MKRERITALFLACLLVTTGLTACSPGASDDVKPNEIHTIPFPEDYDITSSGASSYANSGDHFASPYFAHPDYYNMTSTETLTIIPRFATYQQTTEWSCGPVSVLMVLHHYGNEEWEEIGISEITETFERGASPFDLVRFFKHIDWDYDTSPSGIDPDNDAPVFDYGDTDAFTPWVIGHLKEGTPIMINWPDWDGHWQVIIGYDTMGTDGVGDDVLIVADPYDTSDHYQDGYMAISAERFFYMWHSGDGHDTQPYVIGKPKAAVQ